MPHIPNDGTDAADLSLGLLLTGPQPTGLFLLGHMKSLVYETPVDSGEDLVERIVVAPDKINTTPGIFESMSQSFFRRCKLCNDTRSRHFQHLL
ncbi:hypothetical protein AVEN_187931-1 [Araneus ventricosus]|uniref:Uncharacterized protein n=1 Tax=Araneus ventricosus TaxID=182803 RepID=A0A4Y2DZV1_ARAVE|nr:hypothetical protein AVEN_187931-1 [Araneus ventricosus]